MQDLGFEYATTTVVGGFKGPPPEGDGWERVGNPHAKFTGPDRGTSQQDWRRPLAKEIVTP